VEWIGLIGADGTGVDWLVYIYIYIYILFIYIYIHIILYIYVFIHFCLMPEYLKQRGRAGLGRARSGPAWLLHIA